MYSSTPTSPTLLGRVKDGDTQAWTTFVELYYLLIFTAARRACSCLEDAQDVTQDVFARLLKALPQFNYNSQTGHFRGYLRTVTHNAVVSHFRKNARAPRGSGDPAVQAVLELHPDARWWDAAYAERVLDWALERARAHFRENTVEAFRLIYLGQRETGQVEVELGMTYAAVTTACSKVKAYIEYLIREEGVEL